MSYGFENISKFRFHFTAFDARSKHFFLQTIINDIEKSFHTKGMSWKLRTIQQLKQLKGVEQNTRQSAYEDLENENYQIIH